MERLLHLTGIIGNRSGGGITIDSKGVQDKSIECTIRAIIPPIDVKIETCFFGYNFSCFCDELRTRIDEHEHTYNLISYDESLQLQYVVFMKSSNRRFASVRFVTPEPVFDPSILVNQSAHKGSSVTISRLEVLEAPETVLESISSFLIGNSVNLANPYE